MKVKYLIVDSGAFIKNVDIKEVGTNIYTCGEVVREIRDKATKQRLSVLPYDLKFKDPNSDSIKKITEVSKKTGDYGSLSSTDVKVLALTYELALQHDKDFLTDIDVDNNNVIQLGGDQKQDALLPGFYMPTEDEKEQQGEQIEDKMVDLKIMDNENLTPEEMEKNEEEEDIGGGGEGWITPSYLREMEILRAQVEDNEKELQVGCITTDFAMQNVLLKMKMNIISVEGLLIKTLRSYVLRCHACYEVTKVMTKVFCPKCGNQTLKRVPVETQPDGTLKMFFSRNPKVLSARGKQYSIPMPRGGKHSNNPILVEDQNIPHDRPSKKALAKTNVWDNDYDCHTSPFANNEINSRAFRLGVRAGNNNRGRAKGNPNAVGKKFVKRK